MNRNEYEDYLNQSIGESLSLDEIKENYSHLSSERVIIKNAIANTMGTLIRRKDVVSFEVGYHEKKREKCEK